MFSFDVYDARLLRVPKPDLTSRPGGKDVRDLLHKNLQKNSCQLNKSHDEDILAYLSLADSYL